jgi:hypothetical protein
LKPLPLQSYADLRNAGFLPKRAFLSPWSEEEKDLLRSGLLQIRRQLVTMHTIDKYYYLAHHVMGKRKTAGQCKAAVQALWEGRSDW